MPAFDQLLCQIKHCTLCAASLPDPPAPILQASPEARILIIGQAPGRITRERGRPWDDASGERLRTWMGIDQQAFYASGLLGIVPMGFCYPGKGRSGDMPPRPECAPAWHALLLAAMPHIELTLLIGKYAQDYYLSDSHTLTERVRHNQLNAPCICMPHPSPRNRYWLKQNDWFEREQIPRLQQRIHQLIS